MNDIHNLNRFLDAQNPVYESVLNELKNARKQGHWMWFIFPQIVGLGKSPTARTFAIKSTDEAKAYWKHPVLGARLRECTSILLELQDPSAEQIFGYPDVLKFRSSMTLFASITENQLFQDALDKFYDGKPDPLTLKILRSL